MKLSNEQLNAVQNLMRHKQAELEGVRERIVKEEEEHYMKSLGTRKDKTTTTLEAAAAKLFALITSAKAAGYQVESRAWEGTLKEVTARVGYPDMSIPMAKAKARPDWPSNFEYAKVYARILLSDAKEATEILNQLGML